ncbi:hypothetical protein [Actinokineospora globicatena]|uniref:Uncharacterized protein n=1 Tax=Actinokineospora globicatena TaxID=103729 RepID=A0A9W6V8V2_9PSEU|nr:hypothetical protein [Actinokineospora globicatena]GLW90303.1 hypothetical protein Aglo03_11190 [Actinokineospora globicatena]
MVKKLGELFAESQGEPLEVDGQLVHMAYELPDPADGDTVRVAFQGAVGDYRQGLVVSVRSGALEVGGQSYPEIVLWTDTAPPEVSLTVRRGKGSKPFRVMMWNTWVDGMGIEQAWVGNSGIVTDADGPTAVLRCSNGYGDPSFTDLVVAVSRG